MKQQSYKIYLLSSGSRRLFSRGGAETLMVRIEAMMAVVIGGSRVWFWVGPFLTKYCGGGDFFITMPISRTFGVLCRVLNSFLIDVHV